MWKIEITDTFGGESNYSWVKRGTLPSNATKRQIIKTVRDLAHWPVGCVRITTDSFGDMYEIRPKGICQVAFVTFEDSDH